MMSLRIPRRGVLALATLIVMVPAAIVFADGYRRDSSNRVIHHHTSAYSVYYFPSVPAEWKDQAEAARSEWNTEIGQRAQGAHISLPKVDTASDSVGADSQPEITVTRQEQGDTGSYVNWISHYHDASSPVTINAHYTTLTADGKRGRMCRAFGNLLGLAGGSNSDSEDCMQDPAHWKNVSDDSVKLVTDYYGPNVSIDSPLVTRNDDVKTTGVYDVDATASGHATKSVTIKLDGDVIASKTQAPCAGSCDLSPDSPAMVQNLEPGTYPLTVTAKNEFDQATTKTITLSVSPPTPDWGFAETWTLKADPNNFGQIPRTGQADPTDLGATTNRLVARWDKIEPEAPDGDGHHYPGLAPNNNLPQAYQDMLDAGEKPIVTVLGTPDWARVAGWQACAPADYPDGCAYPPDPSHYDDWQEFVRQVVGRFPQALAIEIWNEPNLQTSWYYPLPSAPDYADVLHAGCMGAKQGAQDAGLPLPPVISAGLSPGAAQPTVGADPVQRQQGTFLSNLYAAESNRSACVDSGPSPDFKGIGEHVYATGSTNQQWVSNQTATIDELRTVRHANSDDSTRIWITEDGVTTARDLSDANRRSQADQGPLLIALYKNAGDSDAYPNAAPDVKSFIIFRYRDKEADNAETGNRWAHIGIVHDDFTAKPAFGDLRCALGGRKCDD